MDWKSIVYLVTMRLIAYNPFCFIVATELYVYKKLAFTVIFAE